MLKLGTRKKQNQIYKIGSAIFMAGLMGCDPSGGEVHNKDISDLHQKMVNLEDSMKKLPPEVPANGKAVEELKQQMANLNARIEAEGGSSSATGEPMAAAQAKMGEVEAFYGARQTPFFKQCIASINIGDAEDPVKRKVVNAIAFINSSKIARATQITQQDFDHVSGLHAGLPSGYVFVGTKSDLRKANNSHTYHAFSRLPSYANFETLNYFDFDLVSNNISGFGTSNIDKFSVSDKDRVYRSLTGYDILVAQDANEAIDANKIESYSREDCEKIATYMSNVGSKALSFYVDEPIFRTNLRNSKVNDHFMSDVLARLNDRFEAHMTADLKHAFRDTDSHRVMVLQDDLMRRDSKGQVDYSFLDLVNAPHLRYFAAFDSQIGNARLEAGSDFDNDYQGKNPNLTEFVKRHRTQVGVKRVNKEHRDLEAVFVKFVQPDAPVPVVEDKPVHENIFHTN